MVRFNQACTLCCKVAVKKIPREWGYSPMSYYLCIEHLIEFVRERKVKEAEILEMVQKK